MQLRSHRVFPLRCLLREAGRIAGVLLVTAGAVQAAPLGPASELSPDIRPVLVLQPPQGPLQLVHPGARSRQRSGKTR